MDFRIAAFLVWLSVVLIVIGIMILKDSFSEWKNVAENTPFLSGILPLFDLEQVNMKLDKSGNPLNISAEGLIGVKIVAAVTVFIFGLGFTIIGIPLILIFVLSFFCYMLPNVILNNITEKRQKKIYRDFPGMLSLIVTAVGAGIDFDTSLQVISKRFPGPLGEELRIAWKHIAIGRSKAEVFRQMAKRTGVPIVERFFETIITARERGGVQLSVMIDKFNLELVDSQRRKIQEEANKIPTKMLLPIFLCIFAPTLLMILTPVMINLFTVLK